MEVLRDWEQSLSDAPKVTHSPPQSSRRVLTSSTTGVSVVPRLIALKDLFQQRSAQCTSVCSQAQELERQVTQLNTKLQLLEGKHEQALRKKESEHAQHIKDATAQAVQQVMYGMMIGWLSEGELIDVDVCVCRRACCTVKRMN